MIPNQSGLPNVDESMNNREEDDDVKSCEVVIESERARADQDAEDDRNPFDSGFDDSLHVGNELEDYKHPLDQ